MYGKHHSSETKKKISESLSGENNYNYGKGLFGKDNSFYSKHHTLEAKQKISKEKKDWWISRMERIIIVADFHFDKHINFPGKFESDLEGFKKLYGYAKDSYINYVFIAGDLLDKNNRVDVAVYSQIYDVIHSSGVRTILIPGNHDILNKKRFNECILRPFGNRFEHTQQLDTSGPNLVAWEPSIVVIGKCKIALIPYSDKPEQTEKWIVQCGKVDYIIGHFSVKGMSEHIDNSIDSGKVNDRKFIKAFLGHYHKEIEIGSYYHIGAFTQRNFGEEGNSTGFIVLDVDGNSTPTTIRVEVPGLKIFKTIKISNDEDYKLFKEKYNEGKFDKYFVRVDYGKDLKRFTRNFDKEIDFNQLEKTRDKVIYDVDSNIKDMLVDYTNRTCKLNNIEKVIERGLDVVSTIGGNK